MSYYHAHQRMRPVLDLARRLDIATNPAPEALFEAGLAGFQIWCTPADHPPGWESVPMTQGAFAKPCAYVASVHWVWNEAGNKPHIVALGLSSDAYDLGEHRRLGRHAFHNRPEDLAWTRAKLVWLFTQAGVAMPPIQIEA